VYNPKILLLDDNRDLLQIIQIILKGQGYDTVLASSIEEARTKIRIHRPFLILMDLFIAEQDGSQFCSELKTPEEAPRVILMSGYDASASLINKSGADDFMTKPFDYSDLLNRVQRQMTAAPFALA
jgi:DNA-binding response OmpR family regulator